LNPSVAVAARSAGILLYRRTGAGVEVLLVHPGGPLWARRDAGAWSIPKGEHGDDEDAAAAARREFAEEIGSPAPVDLPVDLGEVRQRSGKLVRAWGAPGDLDADAIVSNSFTMEWPPRSGRMREFPEVDRAAWFTVDQARERINPGQVPLLERLEQALGQDSRTGSRSSP
jgi:predicted NUDIX family NTP pyrophosphohydrolase